MKKIGSLVLVSVLLTSGCAVFRENNLPIIDDANYKFENQQKVKVFSRWSINTDNSFANDQTKAAGSAIHKDMFEKAISESGCCTVVEGPDQADVVVTGVALDENNPAAMIPAFITGLSLFTIPSWATATIHIQVEAKSDKKTRTYDLSDSMTMVQWLPMIFVLPFTGTPIEAGKEIDANIYRNLVVKMQEDDLLSQ